jgi:hypothetical protein
VAGHRHPQRVDPQFIEKVRDVAGLYLDPPEKAFVLAAGAAPGLATTTPHTKPGREEVAAAPPPLSPALHPASSSWMNLVERSFAELTKGSCATPRTAV